MPFSNSWNLWVKVGDEMIWESKAEKLLGVTVDTNLNFNTHLLNLCKKASQKVSALARITRILPFHKRRLILKSFIESQFSHCPLVWMFCSRKMNRKMNYIHEKSQISETESEGQEASEGTEDETNNESDKNAEKKNFETEKEKKK